MKRFVIYILLTIVPFVASPSSAPVVKEKVEAWDSYGNVDYRKPPADKIDAFKKNPAYNYDRNKKDMNIIQRILSRLAEWFLDGLVGNAWLRYVLGGIVVLFILFLILRLLNIRAVGFFAFSKKNKTMGLDFVHSAEENTKEEFLKMFRLYRDNNAYREAVRMLYLIYIKELNDTGLIRLAKNKTGKDYVYELKDSETQNTFKKLSRLYEYVWFGQFDIAESKFAVIEQDFVKHGKMKLS